MSNNRITEITAKKEVIPKMDRKKHDFFTNIEKVLDCNKAWSTKDKPFELAHKACKTHSSPPIEKRTIYNIFERN